MRFADAPDERLERIGLCIQSLRVCPQGSGMAHCHDVIPDKSEFGNFLTAGLLGDGWGIPGKGWAAEEGQKKRALGAALACVDKSSLHLV